MDLRISSNIIGTARLRKFLTLFGIALTQRIAIVVNATVDARQVENRNTVGFCLIDDATCDLIDISALVTVDRGFSPWAAATSDLAKRLICSP